MKLPPKAFRFISPAIRALSGSDRDAWNLWVERGTESDLTPRAALAALRAVEALNASGRRALAEISDIDSDDFVGVANDIAYFEALGRALRRAAEAIPA